MSMSQLKLAELRRFEVNGKFALSVCVYRNTFVKALLEKKKEILIAQFHSEFRTIDVNLKSFLWGF